jgi:BON domain
MKYSALPSLLLAGTLAVSVAACDREPRRTAPPANDPSAPPAAREPGRDAAEPAREAGRDVGAAVGTAGQVAAGAAETFDVKAALMRDDGVDASSINVDTDGVKKVVVLKGTVATAAQRTRAEQIAAREAKGYSIDNQLVVRAR